MGRQKKSVDERMVSQIQLDNSAASAGFWGRKKHSTVRIMKLRAGEYDRRENGRAGHEKNWGEEGDETDGAGGRKMKWASGWKMKAEKRLKSRCRHVSAVRCGTVRGSAQAAPNSREGEGTERGANWRRSSRAEFLVAAGENTAEQEGRRVCQLNRRKWGNEEMRRCRAR
jgi:hypothetical protein